MAETESRGLKRSSLGGFGPGQRQHHMEGGALTESF